MISMKRVLLATGHELLDQHIRKFEGYTVEHAIYNRNELLEASQFFHPEMLVVSDYLTGTETLIELIIEVKRMLPETEIIYITTKVNPNDTDRTNQLASLVMVGVYPVLVDKALTPARVKQMMDNPPKREEVDWLLRYYRKSAKKKDDLFEVQLGEQDVQDLEEEGYPNVFLISSIKPGSGKSFVSVNVAMTIAKFGKRKEDGNPPRVALIEADLQNLSLGTLLGFKDDDERNLKTAMDAIATIITKDNELIDDRRKVDEVDEFVASCFKPQYLVKNLEALVGSQLAMEELENIRPIHYSYLIDFAADQYDVVIIDSNSNLAHTTTLPVLQLSNRAYYVINLDFNNIRNNVRYKHTLKGLGVLDKVRYILNEDYNVDYMRMYNLEEPEELQFTAEAVEESGFDIRGRIPIIPKAVFLNRLYESIPICLDNEPYTVLPRLEIAKIANEMWPIDNLEFLQNEWDNQLKKLYGKKKGFFRRG
jgi:cellulose biosynthesis protein BcsQ